MHLSTLCLCLRTHNAADKNSEESKDYGTESIYYLKEYLDHWEEAGHRNEVINSEENEECFIRN